mgnify:CR=1 FL=1
MSSQTSEGDRNSETAKETKKTRGRPKASATKPAIKVNGHMIGSSAMEERQLRVRAEIVAQMMSDHIGFDVTPAQACMHGLHLAFQLHDHSED